MNPNKKIEEIMQKPKNAFISITLNKKSKNKFRNFQAKGSWNKLK